MLPFRVVIAQIAALVASGATRQAQPAGRSSFKVISDDNGSLLDALRAGLGR